MEFNYSATPSVTVAGIPDPPRAADHKESHVLYTARQLERVTVCESNTTLSPVVAKVAAKLASLSVDSPQWDPRSSKSDRIKFRFCNYVDSCSKSVAPSILSPKNRENTTSPIFTAQWVEKYMYVQPAAVLAFFNAPEQGSAAEDDSIAAINGLVDESGQSGGTQLMAVCVGSQANLARVMPILRRETDSSHPTRLLSSADDLNEQEVESFVSQLNYAVTTVVDAFFTQKLERLREKRKNVAPPLDLMVWDTRYTMKLAFCSEFKGDVAGAMRLYESAYDSLSVLFENGAITAASPSYKNARACLDLIALKIFQHSSPSKMAYSKSLSHIETIAQVMKKNNIDPESASALSWKASQYAIFAQLCATFRYLPEAATTPSYLQPGGMPTGLVWLEAASHYARAELNSDDNGADPYNPQENRTKPEFTPQHCFITAISDLSGFRRSKAYALTQYGDWLNASTKDESAAAEAYKSASSLLAPNTWPQSQKYLGTRLNDQLTLFALGDMSAFPTWKPISENEADIEKEVNSNEGANNNSEETENNDGSGRKNEETTDINSGNGDTVKFSSVHTPTVNDLLFHVHGNWKTGDTHIGREIDAQVTLSPKSSKPSKIDKITIKTSLESIVFEHDENCTDENIVIAGKSNGGTHRANLFFDNSSKIFQFGNTPIEMGLLLLESVVIAIGEFSQTSEIKRATNQWVFLNSAKHVQTRHLELVVDPRKAVVSTRPAKLKLKDLSPPVAALGERFKFEFEITSAEEEEVDALIVIELVATANEKPREVFSENVKLIPGDAHSVKVSSAFDVPNALFESKLSTKFETKQDTLPVTFEYVKEVDVARPFRVTFDIVPEYYEHEWPVVFAPLQDIPAIPRKWRLTSTSLATFESEPLILRSAELDLKSKTADFTLCEDTDTSKPVDSQMPYNSLKQLSHSFLAQSKDATVAHPSRSFEAAAIIVLKWSRSSTPEIVNTFALPSVRLNLPTQEPRVLVVCDRAGHSSSITQVTYHIENATAKSSNFSVQMSSSTYFAYQGPRVSHVKMLPFSTRQSTYQLVPLGDGSVQNRRPLPDLRVYDVNYKRSSPIAPGDKSVFYDQGTLFI